MLWATRSGIDFFRGFSRLPVPPGRRGKALTLLVVLAALAILLALAYFLSILGVLLFVVVVALLVRGPLNRLEKANLAHDMAILDERRHAAAESDTDFRLR